MQRKAYSGRLRVPTNKKSGMPHLFKALGMSALPLLHAARQRLIELLDDQSHILLIDCLLLAALGILSILLWCCVLRRVHDITLQLLVILTAVYAALICTHVVVTMLELMHTEHPYWMTFVANELHTAFSYLIVPQNITAAAQ